MGMTGNEMMIIMMTKSMEEIVSSSSLSSYRKEVDEKNGMERKGMERKGMEGKERKEMKNS